MRIYKPTYTKPMPEGAKIFTPKGKKYKCAKFKDRKGHTQEARLTKQGDKIRLETEHWHIRFEDNQLIHRDIKAYNHRQATEKLADRIQQLLNCKATNTPLDTELQKFVEQIPSRIRDELISFEILDANRTAAGKTLLEYIEGFKEYLTKKERDAKHINATAGCLQRLIEGCGFMFWSDITGDKIIDYLTEKRDGGNGISKRTYNGYIKAAKHLCKWLAKQLKTTSPITHLDGLENEGTDKRHPRRAATVDEIRRLLETTRNGPERYGLSGYERWLLYWLTVETGLRAGEIRKLTVSRFDFNEGTITVDAAYSKHRRQDIIPLRTDLASELQSYFANKLPAAKAFCGRNRKQLTDRTAAMIKADLTDAGIPYVDEAGRYFDFHAQRHTSITNLKNAPSRVAQSLARHQSSAMTDRYTHIRKHDERAALEDLPDFTSPSSEKQRAVKTGTDDTFLPDSCFQSALMRTRVNNTGKKNIGNVQKTQLSVENKEAVQTLNQQVEGSSPSSLIQKPRLPCAGTALL
jgi:integrase